MKQNVISKSKAIELIQESKGKFFSVIFKKEKGTVERTMNCQFKKIDNKANPSPLGYFLLKDTNIRNGESKFRNVDVRTISKLKISGKEYKINN